MRPHEKQVVKRIGSVTFFPLVLTGASHFGCSDQPVGDFCQASETFYVGGTPESSGCTTLEPGWFVRRITLTGHSFYPPKGRMLNLHCIEGLYQIIHGGTARAAFENSTSGRVVVDEEEDTSTSQMLFEFPSDQDHCEKFDLTNQVIPHKVSP